MAVRPARPHHLPLLLLLFALLSSPALLSRAQPTETPSPSATASASASASPSATSTGTVSVTPSQSMLPQLWLRASGAAPGDGFGSAVRLSSDGSFLLAASPGSGTAVVFKRVLGLQYYYRQVSVLRPSSGGDPSFGRPACLALSGDGSLAVVGQPGADAGAGAVRVFARRLLPGSDDGYDEVQVLRGERPGEGLGGSCAMTAAGDVLVVGAPASGLVRAYGRAAAAPFSPLGAGLPLSIPGSTPDWGFGSEVTLCDDAAYVVVAAAGARRVFVYERAGTPAAAHFVLQRALNALDAHPISSGFGASASLSGDCRVLLVGQPGNATLQVYDQWLGGQFLDQSQETETGTSSLTRLLFGASVGVSADGRVVVVAEGISGGGSDDYQVVYYKLAEGHGSNGASLVTGEKRVYGGFRGAVGWAAAVAAQPDGQWPRPSAYPLPPLALSADGTVLVAANLQANSGEGEVLVRLLGTPQATATATATMTATPTPSVTPSWTPTVSTTPSPSPTPSPAAQAAPAPFPVYAPIVGAMLGVGIVIAGFFAYRRAAGAAAAAASKAAGVAAAATAAAATAAAAPSLRPTLSLRAVRGGGDESRPPTRTGGGAVGTDAVRSLRRAASSPVMSGVSPRVIAGAEAFLPSLGGSGAAASRPTPASTTATTTTSSPRLLPRLGTISRGLVVGAGQPLDAPLPLPDAAAALRVQREADVDSAFSEKTPALRRGVSSAAMSGARAALASELVDPPRRPSASAAAATSAAAVAVAVAVAEARPAADGPGAGTAAPRPMYTDF
jgi:hypothetical protein